MLFSVLVPVYNVKEYLKQCLDSILSQDFQDFELIIIDDGSFDGSEKICDDYKDRFPEKIILKHKKNEGLIMARREAIKLASGDYILFCDSDDFYEPGAFSLLKTKIDKFNADIVLYDLYLYETETNKSSNINLGKFLTKPDSINSNMSILRSCLVDRNYSVWAMACKCVKKSCVDANANYRSLKHINYGEDTLQSIEIFSRAKNFVYIPDKIYNYRIMVGMTRKLSINYIEDFFEIGEILQKANKRWQLNSFEERISFYYLSIVYFLVINMSVNNDSYRLIKVLFSRVAREEKFKNSWKKIKDKKVLNERRKMKFVLYLIYHHFYFFVYLTIQIRKVIKVERR